MNLISNLLKSDKILIEIIFIPFYDKQKKKCSIFPTFYHMSKT